MRRLFSAAVLVFILVAVAACKRGMPPECEQYLARYECWLGKSGMGPERKQTIDTMRTTWMEASKSGPGRKAVLQACNQSQTQMADKFATAGCMSAAPEAR